ncbi:MAG: phosphatase PAP2 family protein, partial [Deltaproteobacteria bacterium]|nr:phosphatase PAP2 family protein [Deltaproteobacteria bacterium]
GNCLPSLHAANCLLFMHFNRTRPAPRLHGALAAAIIASTLLVKQHYAVDLVAGGLVYAATATFLRSIEIAGAEAAKSDGDGLATTGWACWYRRQATSRSRPVGSGRRLAKAAVTGDDERLAKEGLGDWAAALDGEDRH